MNATLVAQEEQEKLRPGTHKAAVFEVLKAAGADGLTVQEILAAGRDAGLKDWDDSSRRMIAFVSPPPPSPSRPATGQK